LVVRILILCAGNICRSPLAEELLRRALARRGVEAQISSAGIWAEGGLPASAGASRAGRRLGIDLGPHRSAQLDLAEVARADVVLVMTTSQRDELVRLDPQVSGKVVPLGDKDIDDPYLGDPATYEACAAEIEAACEALAERAARKELL
jgi:protein-tyrosine phosphatase